MQDIQGMYVLYIKGNFTINSSFTTLTSPPLYTFLHLKSKLRRFFVISIYLFNTTYSA
jgi:hypothetical protein